MSAPRIGPLPAGRRATVRKIGLVGHPNVGKSAIFSLLTGRFVTISNFPGTTVEVFRGRLTANGQEFELVDTPGVNGLRPHSDDERVTVRLLETERPDLILQVADGANLRRTLLLTAELGRLGIPLVLNLNMKDEREDSGVHVDAGRLSRLLGIPVVETVAVRGEGIEALATQLESRARLEPIDEPPLIWAEDVVDEVQRSVNRPAVQSRPGRTARAALLAGAVVHLGNYLGALANIPTPVAWISNGLTRLSVWPELADGAGVIGGYVLPVLVPLLWVLARDIEFRRRLGVWSRKPLTGGLILLLTVSLIYQLVGHVGAQTLVALLEERLFGGWALPWLQTAIPPGFFHQLMVGKYGLISVGLSYGLAIVLPVVFSFFLAFSFLEDSGYLPRLSLLSHRLLRPLGLNGKAFLPMVLGLGCVTMATLTTRILHSRKERLIASFLLALGVPCSAQLGVILGIAAGLSPWASLTIFATVALQVILAGMLLSRLIPGTSSQFILEIPPIRFPRWSNILRKTWLRVKWFLREALPLFLLGALILFALERLGWLASIIAATAPLFVDWLGLPAETATAFLVGFLRRDYGAAGLFQMARQGLLDPVQIVVSLTMMILFVPCVANFFVLIKEHRLPRAVAVLTSITLYSLLVGVLLNLVLRQLGITF